MLKNEFEIEEADIVRLSHESGHAAGWVNIGKFALYIELWQGDLQVQAYPRTMEGGIPMYELNITLAEAEEYGGRDPDEEELLPEADSPALEVDHD